MRVGWPAREFGLRTALVLTIALLALGTLMPVAAAEPNGFGNCWVVYTRVAVVDGEGNTLHETDVPRGIACAW